MLSLHTGFGSNSRKPYRIHFLTDFHARSDLGAPQALEKLADAVNHSNPDLVIGGGDCIHGGFSGLLDVSRERFEIFRNFTRQIKPRAHWLIGNHDFARAVDEEDNILDGDPTAMFKQTMETSDLYFGFDAGEIRCLALQSVKVLGGKQKYQGLIDATQLAWLRSELAKLPQEQPIIIKLPGKGLEPPRLAALDPKSSVSTNFTTPASGLPISA